MKVAKGLGLVMAFVALTYAYLYPGSELLRRGDVTRVMSDDSDPSSLPHAYGSLLRAFHRDPTSLLYGAVYMDQGHPRHDSVTWISWVERWIVVAGSAFVPLEQMSTFVVFVLLVANALAFFALARAWGVGDPASFALATAWAFCPFTRARAKVHTAMAGTFHLPLIFLGLHLVATRRDRRSLVLAALCFVGACTALQYLVITAAALTPFYAAYVVLTRGDLTIGRVARRTVGAALPALCFPAWNLKMPVPGDVTVPADELFPKSGDVAEGRVHPFLNFYAARPLDYLGSDIALTEPAGEWLAPRDWVNGRTLASLGPGNPHERTNGIRWSLLALAAIGLVIARGADRRRAVLFALFGAACFWLSLAPDATAPGFGASEWLWRLVHAVRVPSRAGIGVHFAVLSIVALTLRRAQAARWRAWTARALPLVVILEYPPFATAMPFAPMRPRYDHLARDGACATGLMFPFVNDELYMVIYYHFKQRLRDTGCTFVNALTDRASLENLYRRFPTSNEYLGTLERDDVAETRVISLARCAPLGWIAFDEITPPAWRQRVCDKLGWRMHPDLTCVDPGPVRPMTRLPDACP